MTYDTIITCHEAVRHLEDPAWIYVDCRANMADQEYGHREYCQAHLPGAVYAGLDDDLSGPVIPGRTGRHPLPSREQLIALFAHLGISSTSQVVVYDEQAGQMAAARLWWLLKWAGHDAVAVLDGGFQQWQAMKLPTGAGAHHNPPAPFTARFQDRLLVTADDVSAVLGNPDSVLVDSRAADRYRGENEIIDPVAGHIPGAINAPFAESIATDGTLKPPLLLKEHFRLREIDAKRQPVFYCGSGVTAAQNIVAYVRAGLGMPQLYAGSWSDWITDPARPVATGSKPGTLPP
jgi:thiosulfate/3-mercaptopyruvate sulfurtransferase